MWPVCSSFCHSKEKLNLQPVEEADFDDFCKSVSAVAVLGGGGEGRKGLKNLF